MQDVMDVIRAMGDENRIHILLALNDGELCVCQLIELLGLAPSTVSKHLSILRSARLVESRKEGRWIYYQLSSSSRYRVQQKIFRLVSVLLSDSAQAVSDGKLIAKIRKMNMEKLCRKLMKRS